MRRIAAYLVHQLEATILVPKNADFLSAKMENAELWIYASVDPEEKNQARHVWVIDNREVPLHSRYVDHVEINGQRFHIFTD